MKEKRKETQEKDLPKPKRQRIEETLLELPEVLWKGIPHPGNSSSFLPITLHQKRCIYVPCSTVLSKFTLKLFCYVFCFIYSLNKWIKL